MDKPGSRSSASVSSGPPSTAHASQSQSVSSRATHKRGKVDTGKRAAQGAVDREKNADNVTKVLDPETKEDRTPLSLLRTAAKALGGTGAAGKADRKRASETGVSPASGSQVSEVAEGERSASRMESTESGSTTPKSTSLSMSEGEEAIEPLALDESLETSSIDSSRHASDRASSKAKEKTSDKGDPEEEDDEKAPEKEKTMSQEERRAWLAAPCTLVLSETSTFFLLERPDEQVAVDSEEAPLVQQQNQIYQQLCSALEVNKYVERGMQTFNNPFKSKESQFSQTPVNKVAAGVTTWEIFDTMRKLEEEELDVDILEMQHMQPEQEEQTGGGDADEETGAYTDAEDDGGGGGDGEKGGASFLSKSKRHAWATSPYLPYALMMVERMIVQNIWQDEQLLYRNVNPLQFRDPDPEEAASPTSKERSTRGSKRRGDMESSAGRGADYAHDESDRERDPDRDRDRDRPAREAAGSGMMKTLWRFGSGITANKNVSCLAWNHSKTDILAVGYGDFGISAAKLAQQGLVCCWSLKNPVHPERVFKINNAGVASVDFSHQHPSLLAVGHTDGTLTLYDVRKQGNTPAMKSTVAVGQHTGTVWEVKWVEKGKDRGETLISISADGRVTDWSIKKA